MSVGVAHFDPDEPVTLQELMRQADTELYEHKRKHRLATSKGRRPSAAPLETIPTGMETALPRG
jgi:GGDEF domain-containing protein